MPFTGLLGCTTAGVELEASVFSTSKAAESEVILPRLLLQVRGSTSETVCGLRIRGTLEEQVGL